MGLAGTFFFIGCSIGSIAFPPIADFWGRKPVLILSLLIGGSTIFIASYVNSVWILIALIFTSGMSLMGYECLCYVLISELSGIRFRNYASTTVLIAWAGAQIIFSPLAYLLPNWRSICRYLIGLPIMLSAYLVVRYLDETPRHLLQIGEYALVKAVLNKIATYDKRPPF